MRLNIKLCDFRWSKYTTTLVFNLWEGWDSGPTSPVVIRPKSMTPPSIHRKVSSLLLRITAGRGQEKRGSPQALQRMPGTGDSRIPDSLSLGGSLLFHCRIVPYSLPLRRPYHDFVELIMIYIIVAADAGRRDEWNNLVKNKSIVDFHDGFDILWRKDNTSMKTCM